MQTSKGSNRKHGRKKFFATPHKLTWSVVIDGWHSQILGVALSMFTDEEIP